MLVGSLALIVAAAVFWFQNVSTGFSETETDSELSTEVERFWFLSKVRRRERDFAGEQRILTALYGVIEGDADHEKMVKQIDDRLIELRKVRREQAEGYQLARDALHRAESLIEQKKWKEASLIVNGVVELYGSELGAKTLVANARRLAGQIEAGRTSEESPVPEVSSHVDD